MKAPPLGVTARATVLRVIDGDTLDVTLEVPLRLRLLDCWAPEMHGSDRIAGAKAKEQLEALLPLGTQVHVHVPTGKAQSLGNVLTFSRVLGHVFIPGQDQSISEQMVASGCATKEK